MLWGREPVLYLTLLEVILILLVSFGLHLSDGQVTAIVAVAAAVIGLIARRQVTPVGKARQDAQCAFRASQADAEG